MYVNEFSVLIFLSNPDEAIRFIVHCLDKVGMTNWNTPDLSAIHVITLLHQNPKLECFFISGFFMIRAKPIFVITLLSFPVPDVVQLTIASFCSFA